ncbi:acetyl-CoA carboxylase biotin carboxyl carrier protein [Candidatus Acetothermia bacterium]|nr:acetyl-CoA carboxylase biotin carboxyl carrier protein [Candidatus Acetothermia bacterium]MBI3659133.1 acetyl-CoA carboxylase biotin carboxyl carrier protein [Candidatus Acetothermia bacterium]
MEVNEIQALIEMFERSTLSELTLERGGERLILKRDPVQGGVKASSASVKATANPVAPAPAPASIPTAPTSPVSTAEKVPEKLEGYVVKSPIVGTFYRRPGPNEEPYVVVGDRVEKGDTVCLVEAMKVMNEIKSEQSGIVEKILVEDGKPVEYGQALLVLKAG